MINKRMTIRSATTLIVGLVLFASVFAAAVPAQAQTQNEQYMELLRQDLRTGKMEVMTEAMALTDEQGAVFWPIYREYQTKLSVIGDKRIAMIKEYAENYENMTGEKASELMKVWFGQQKDRLSLLEKTAKKVAKDVDPVTAARFIQVENAVNMLIDLQIASELPLFTPGPVVE
ncbi:MAG: hypothetical protein KAH56_13385, partial [Candidatus Krumholzibacteria bacterium]|nr:hypothetical protein [Candidatus Krumholzibacteria bacterium]